MSVDKHFSFSDVAAYEFEVLVVKVIPYDDCVPDNAAVTKFEIVDPDKNMHDKK